MPAQLPEFPPMVKGLLVAFAISLVIWLAIGAFVWSQW